MSDNRPDILTSEAIMTKLERAATDSSRGQKRLETLRRLKTACDDIASGKAVDYAEKAGMDSTPFKIQPRRINSRTVGEYIISRRRLAGSDGEKLWPGPIASTLRGDIDVKSYLDARQTETNGFQKKRPKSTRSQTISEIASAIPRDHDRLLNYDGYRGGREAQRKLRLASAAVPKLWAVDLER